MLDYIKSLFKNKKAEAVASQNHASTPIATTPTAAQTANVRLSEDDLERCLLQQTTSYERGKAILAATNKENELFLIHYYDNTFFIVKTAYENNKLNVVCDYRRKSFILEEFQYHIYDNSATAMLKLLNTQVDFTVTPQIEYHGDGCELIRNQSAIYDEFVSYLDRYRENINSSAMMRRNENDYSDLTQATRKISHEERKAIFTLLDEGNQIEAIKQIQKLTGLGLADCKKIADSPYMYL